jgi:hypothetical protein
MAVVGDVSVGLGLSNIAQGCPSCLVVGTNSEYL